MGLKNVRLEWVPVDSQNFKGASVTVGDRFMPASTWGGVPPTSGPVTGEIVYAGWGTAAEFDALEERGIDVAGKIVLIDLGVGQYQQFNMPAAEAVARGAKAIVETVNPADTYYFGGPPDALGNMDGYWQTDFPTIVMVARKDGDWLKTQIAAGKTSASVLNNGELITTQNGGGGYNVYAEIPGRVHPDEAIVISAHHDAFFRAGLDDTGGVVQGMSMAKAMKMRATSPTARSSSSSPLARSGARSTPTTTGDRRLVGGHRDTCRLARQGSGSAEPGVHGALLQPLAPARDPRVHPGG